MAKKTTFQIDKITYLKIREIEFSYLAPDDFVVDENPETIHFSLDVVKMVDPEEGIVRLVFTLHVNTGLENKKEVKGTYITEHLFQINGFEDLIAKTNEDFEVDEALETALTSLAYSTMRGLFFKKFEGTLFSRFILPVTKLVN